MSYTRRDFVVNTFKLGAGVTLFSAGGFSFPLRADDKTVASGTPEQMAYYTASNVAPYVSQQAPAGTDPVTWLQIDLGQTRAIDRVKLYPAVIMVWNPSMNYSDSTHFPLRFKLEASDDPAFATATTIADQTAADFPDPHINISEFPATASGRYVRLTVTKWNGDHVSLAKMDVLAGGTNVAELQPVTADPAHGNGSASQVARRARPMGEGRVTDHPQNVIPTDQWKPVAYAAVTPLGGVTLGDGPFKTAMETNISYLLKETTDDLLQMFRKRAGKTNPPNLRPLDGFWDVDLAGSGAGRFLMSAGNTLRWMEHPQLRAQMNALVDGIADCAEADGYMMAYPRDTIFLSERGAYTRSWVTQGLIEAGYAGNAKAFQILRPYYDWYNKCEYLPRLLRGAGMGPQGMVANTRMHFTPVGKPDDIHVIQRYFQENYLLDGMREREPDLVWQYPYDRPHAYQLTFFEAYMDLYLATGAPRYLEAIHGAWDLYHDHWEHLGGTISITEFEDHPPGSYRLLAGTGELCGSVFWARLNSRLMQLDPEQEKYANEIEKSIYNVGLANQLDDSGIIYHARLTEKKENPTHSNTCCEGQGSRLFGSLPEYIYSIAPDGLYVNLFAPSTITWPHGEQSLTLKSETNFPFANDVALSLTLPQPAALKIRVRIPTWAARAMTVQVNGKLAGTGQPGTYLTLDRTWKSGDTIAFTLPAEFRLTRYTGVDKVPNHPTYGLEYGPILYAMTCEKDFRLTTPGPTAESLLAQLKPKAGAPLHFTIDGNDAHEFIPYWQVRSQRFTCFPIIDTNVA
jgi:DUF1680 family protein